MQERRRAARHTVFKAAKITINGRPALIECTVRNVTNNGACLSLMTTRRIPEAFELSFDNFKTVRKCVVTWRRARELGVRFHAVS